MPPAYRPASATNAVDDLVSGTRSCCPDSRLLSVASRSFSMMAANRAWQPLASCSSFPTFFVAL